MRVQRVTDGEETAVIDDEMIAGAFRWDATHTESVCCPQPPPTRTLCSRPATTALTSPPMCARRDEEAAGEGEKKSSGTAVLAEIIGDATTLRLSFKNVLKIDNLQGFNSLTKLCLDNNIVKEICNLDHLVHLQWLDLSFNNISKIEGLDKLTNLTDLSLFSNRISEVEGLEACTKLQCLSLGNNQISSLDGIVKLRKFKNLHLLNLEGNPVSRESEYRMYVLAYLIELKYLDYAMVVKSEVVSAREQYQDELLDVEEKEQLEEEKAAREAAALETTAKLKAANLAVVETVFSDMFEDDEDNAKLKALPNIGDVLGTFSSEVDAASQQFRQTGLDLDRQKKEELEAFRAAVAKLRSYYAGESVKMIELWVQTKKRVDRELSLQDRVQNTEITPYVDKLGVLSNDLMDLEMRQVEQFEEIMNDFDTKYREINHECTEQQTVYFRAVEDCSNNYLRDLTALANDLLDRMAKEELGDDLPEDAANLLIDRDTCMNAITGSHEVHVGKIFKMEEVTRFAEMQHLNETLRELRDEEHERNRSRIMELHDFKAKNLAALQDLITKEVELDDDEEGA